MIENEKICVMWKSGNWSDKRNWVRKRKPKDGCSVLIDSGVVCYLNQSTPKLKELRQCKTGISIIHVVPRYWFGIFKRPIVITADWVIGYNKQKCFINMLEPGILTIKGKLYLQGNGTFVR